MDKNSKIENMKIKGFKCLDDIKVDFKNLTILTGENSSGKSSLLQSMLIAGNQTHQHITQYIASLGYAELFNKNSSNKEISIKINDKYEYQANKENILKSLPTPNMLSYTDNLVYLNADRHRVTQLTQFFETYKLKDFGIYGDFSSSYYEHYKNSPIESYLIKDNTSYTLETQVNFWLKYISTLNIDFETQKVNSTVVKNTFKIDGESFYPENIGTGLSYLFTILIACLSAKQNNIIIIENPEIHLHPKAQAKLGEFFVFIASKGIQLIIETHNDHIINKMCYEVYNKTISSDDIVIQYFSTTQEHKSIYIDDNGHWVDEAKNLVEFPDGFFDATLDELMEMGG